MYEFLKESYQEFYWERNLWIHLWRNLWRNHKKHLYKKILWNNPSRKILDKSCQVFLEEPQEHVAEGLFKIFSWNSARNAWWHSLQIPLRIAPGIHLFFFSSFHLPLVSRPAIPPRISSWTPPKLSLYMPPAISPRVYPEIAKGFQGRYSRYISPKIMHVTPQGISP